MSRENTHRLMPVICLDHGHSSEMLLSNKQLDLKEGVLCPKCSLKAIPKTWGGLMEAVPYLIRQNASIRRDIFDLQCFVERQTEGNYEG